MKRPLDRIRIAGFKSIRDQTVHLTNLNVLIGGNGAGKSNFISVFRLLNDMVNGGLQIAIARFGGASQVLYRGPRVTDRIALDLRFDRNVYQCRLEAAAADRLLFAEEKAFFLKSDERLKEVNLGSGHEESALQELGRHSGVPGFVRNVLLSWKVYHFHDTSTQAKMKSKAKVDDNRRLHADSGNLAAFLFLLRRKNPAHYRRIVDTVRMVAPFFDDFVLEPDEYNESVILLQWKEKGTDIAFFPDALSDGTLRFIALATLFLQPELPATILLDEPELGLHPRAITLLVELMRQAAEETQVIVSTQSTTLVDQLDPEELIVVDRWKGESVFHRPRAEALQEWLEDYSLGELWQKNVVGGGPGL